MSSTISTTRDWPDSRPHYRVHDSSLSLERLGVFTERQQIFPAVFSVQETGHNKRSKIQSRELYDPFEAVKYFQE